MLLFFFDIGTTCIVFCYEFEFYAEIFRPTTSTLMFASATYTHAETDDVVGYAEFFLVGASFATNVILEDAEFGNLDLVAFLAEFEDAGDHVAEDTFDLRRRVGRGMGRHVFGETSSIDYAVVVDAGVPKAL